MVGTLIRVRIELEILRIRPYARYGTCVLKRKKRKTCVGTCTTAVWHVRTWHLSVGGRLLYGFSYMHGYGRVGDALTEML